jgi:hypothetical protein
VWLGVSFSFDCAVGFVCFVRGLLLGESMSCLSCFFNGYEDSHSQLECQCRLSVKLIIQGQFVNAKRN